MTRQDGPSSVLRIGAVVSMKRGLEHFIHRELHGLAAHGVIIDVFTTRHAPGPYDVAPEWTLHRWTPRTVLATQPAAVARRPWAYLRTLVTAVRHRAVVDFLVAAHYAPSFAQVDVLYATFGDRKLFVGYFGHLLTGRPLMVEVHAYELYSNPNPRLFRTALTACGHVVTVTEHNRDVLERDWGVDRGRVAVVRISVDLDDYRPQDMFVILVVAQFVERKGHETLLRAVAKLARGDVEVWVVGDSGTETRSVDVRGLVEELGLDGQVAFFGLLSGAALKAAYRSCDVFCLPARVDGAGISEGFPTAIAEAMSFGKPVISTRHVEIPRVLPSTLVDEDDVDALAAAIDELRLDAARRQREGERNRRAAERLFSPSNVSDTHRMLADLAVRPAE